MKESGRFILAMLLMVVVIVGTNRLFGPQPQPATDQVPGLVEGSAEGTPEVAGTQGGQVEGGPPVAPTTISGISEAGVHASTDGTGAAAPVQDDTLVVSSPLYRYSFSTRGASVVGAELLRFESAVAEGPVDLVPESDGGLLGYQLRIGDRPIDLRNAEFRPEFEGPVELQPGDAPRTFWFSHVDEARNLSVRIGYTLSPDDYLVRVEGQVVDGSNASNRYLLVDLGPTLASHEQNPAEDQRALAYVVNGTRDGIRSVPLRDVKGERVEQGPFHWVALKNKYFLAAMLDGGDAREGGFAGVLARPSGEPNSAIVTTSMPIVDEDGSFEYRLYMGPQEHSRLAALGDGMQHVNPYGPKFLRPIIKPLGHLITWALVGLHTTLDIAYGWVLILFGVLIRVILWPLNARAMRAQMRNMALQPRIKEIQEKYKSEPERMQQEMIRLYKEEGFNPLGGCLPMLIPFPVLITLFFVFQNTIEFRGTGFLWLADLSAADPYFILPLILGGSMFLMQMISMRSMPPNPQTKMLTYIMPVMMTVIFLRLASGLNLYYAAQNLASIPQQLQIARERKRQQALQAATAR